MAKFFTRCAVVGAVAALLLTGCSANSQPSVQLTPKTRATYFDGTVATVQEVKSGNTITVKIGDRTEDVRLLNVVAPSKNNNELSGNCLIEESKAALAEKLPAGTEVTLNFDPTQTGTSGFVDAAVYAGDRFINREIAATGLVATTFASQQDKFYLEISEAQQQAARDGLGLYSVDTDCSIPHAIQEQINLVNAAGGLEEGERSMTYRKASTFYNELIDQSASAVTWPGSIVTLESVNARLQELQTALGDNYYNKSGKSVAEIAQEEAAMGRPGTAPEAPVEETPSESATPAEGETSSEG